MKVRDIIRLIEADGWYQVSMKGSHRQYKHSTKLGRLTIAGHPSKEMPPGTAYSVLEQAGLRKRN
ncbi:MAG: type II toxin-antitoxin system HicA family toxin [Ktedonobacteraceae bacterium]|nr:type II toxin-antitoxin system HicA family toxin [Ktedonobacteraceae bacterium]